MALTPVEIRHIKPPRGFLGYKRAAVDRLLVDIAESYGDVWRDRADLTDKIEQLEVDLVRHKELEGLLHTTLVSAESAAQQLREQARRKPRQWSPRRTPRHARSPVASAPRRSASRPSFGGSSRCSVRRSTASTRLTATPASPWASRPARSGGSFLGSFPRRAWRNVARCRGAMVVPRQGRRERR